MSDTFNPEMLVLARYSSMKTQQEVADFLQVTQSKIAKFETGRLSPDEQEIARLSFLLGEPPGFFSLPGSWQGSGSGCESYARGRKTTLASIRKRVLADVNKVRFRVGIFFSGVTVETPLRLERIDIDAVNGEAELAAMRTRAAWRLPPGPIPNLTFVTEEAGVVVVRVPFGTDRIDAMSQVVKGYPDIICLNSEQRGEGNRWALAHELGHLVLHAGVACEDKEEKEADRFAAELLMPADDFREDIGAFFDLHYALDLKPKWKVSAKSIVRRAVSLGLIREAQAKWLYVRMNRLGWGRCEPMPLEVERPRAVRDVLDLRLSGQGKPMSEVCQNAEITEERCRAIFFEERRATPHTN